MKHTHRSPPSAKATIKCETTEREISIFRGHLARGAGEGEQKARGAEGRAECAAALTCKWAFVSKLKLPGPPGTPQNRHHYKPSGQKPTHQNCLRRRCWGAPRRARREPAHLASRGEEAARPTQGTCLPWHSLRALGLVFGRDRLPLRIIQDAWLKNPDFCFVFWHWVITRQQVIYFKRPGVGVWERVREVERRRARPGFPRIGFSQKPFLPC